MAKAKQKPSGRAIKRRRTVAKYILKRREAAMGRLGEDGVSASRNISRRLLWLAIEWQLEAPPKVVQTMSEELADYCERHRISYEWMLTSCLKGLKQMIDKRRGRTAAASRSSLRDKLARLSESKRELILKAVEGMLPEHIQ